MTARILVVDDQRNMRTTLALMLKGVGYDVDESEDGQAASSSITEETYDLVLTDLRMGRMGGIDLLRYVKEVSPLTEVIVMTAYGTVESAVEAMRVGAYDYIQKPFAEQELLIKVERALEKRRLAGEMWVLASEFRDRYDLQNIVGRSPSIREILARVVRVASTDATVLITGESGTGKELFARAVHSNSSRAGKPFVTVNCAAINETLLESELFGHVRGAFTGAVSARKGLLEEANGGTFFFDEIAETTPSFQAKLLRAIQEGEIRRIGDNKTVSVDIRVIAATNQDLRQAITDKRFRQDLYYRLNVVRFHIPPLRERKQDIPLLVQFFLDKYNRKMKRDARMGRGVMEFLVNYDYPGNVRELENMVEQGVALSVGSEIPLEAILPEPALQSGELESPTVLQEVVDQAEKQAIERVLREAHGNREKAAVLLGLSPTTLWRKMKRLKVVWP